MEGFLVGGTIAVLAFALMIYSTNRSRCTLAQAVSLSGCSQEELRELIKERLLIYRRKYVLFGPYSLDARQIPSARADLVTIKRVRAETDAHIRQMAEEAAASIRESNRRFQEEMARQEEELEFMRKVHAEILKNMRRQLVPREVVEALRFLDLGPDAPFDEVVKRYRLLAKRYHPDSGGSKQQFIRLQAAYTCVTNWIKSLA